MHPDLIRTSATLLLMASVPGYAQTTRRPADSYGARLTDPADPRIPLNTHRVNNRIENRINNRISLRIERFRSGSADDPTAAFRDPTTTYRSADSAFRRADASSRQGADVASQPSPQALQLEQAQQQQQAQQREDDATTTRTVPK